jgi:hypothetical protein
VLLIRLRQKKSVETSCTSRDWMTELYGATFKHAVRVNCYSVLVQSLLRDYSQLRECVIFLLGLEVERIFSIFPRAWGTECAIVSNQSPSKQYVVLKAKSQIILCAGAIGTPSILLASGIGHEEDLMAAGITPWYGHCNHLQSLHKYLPVGRHLRNHILLPRIFLTRNWQNESHMSNNSIHGWWTIQLCINVEDCAKFQIQLADGIAIDKMLPNFASGPIQRVWVVPGFSFS